MTRILKYKIPVEGGTFQDITFSGSPLLLDVQYQNNELVLWAQVNENLQPKTMTFVGVGTGWDLTAIKEEKFTYFKTVQCPAGFVWHIFWRGK